MTPLNNNDPYIDSTGKRSTLGAEIAAGGGGEPYTLPTASSDTKGGVKIGEGLSMSGEILNNSNPTPYSLPIAGANVLGGIKVGSNLSIDENGVLSASGGGGGGSTKVYYKDFSSISWQTRIPLAKYDNNAASASGYFIVGTAPLYSLGYDISVSGYTPISAVAHDVSTGYQFGVSLQYQMVGSTRKDVVGIGLCNSTAAIFDLRVFYVKNDDVDTIPS